MARVVFEKVVKQYQGAAVPSVRGIDLDVADGEFVVLVGPSGCGKSTTLRMVAGLESITGGTIRIGDRIVNDVPPKDRDIAMVFQNYALYPHMTVYKNIAFGLQLRRKELGLSKADIHERVMNAAKMLGISELLERKPKALSGGQRQRVAVGRAIVRQAKAFLFDEPLSNLDAKLRVETRAEIKRLHQRLGATTIYVTHDQEEAMTLGDRIVVMKDGVIQQCAAPLEVYERPANRFVASFVGMPPMNFLEGRIDRQQSKTLFRSSGQSLVLPKAWAAITNSLHGQQLVLGFRAEGLIPISENQLASSAPGEEELTGLKGVISLVEPLGDRVDIYCRQDGTALAGGGVSIGAAVLERGIVCRTGTDAFGKIKVGGIITFRMDPRRVHLFEPGETGVNITLPNETRHAHA